MSGGVDRVWTAVTSTQAPPAAGVVAGAAVVTLVLVAWDPAWRRTRHLVTIAHEGAHGFVALLAGRRLAGIRLHSDTSGLTVSRGRPSGFGMTATAFAGYVGPALLGLGAAWLLHEQRAVALLWSVLLLLALLLVQIRNWFGLWSVLVAGALVFAVSWWGSDPVQSGFAYAGTWFLLLAAPRPVLELQRQRRRGRARDSDADLLARLTGVPGLAWVGAFGVVSLGGLALGAWLLVAPLR